MNTARRSRSASAALAVLAWHERVDVCAGLATVGARMREVVAGAIKASGTPGVTVEGIDQMWFLRFKDPKVETAFLAAAVRNGVLFKRGAYNFAALAHDDDAIAEIESGASAAFVELREEGA